MAPNVMNSNCSLLHIELKDFVEKNKELRGHIPVNTDSHTSQRENSSRHKIASENFPQKIKSQILGQNKGDFLGVLDLYSMDIYNDLALMNR